MGDSLKLAWLPVTPRGVAAFAHATTGRLWLVQFIFALLTAGVVGWFVEFALFPIVSRAISQLPEQGEIRSRQLDWRGPSPQLLAEGGVLALAVDLDRAGDVRPPADVAIEFGRDNIRARSLFGIYEWRYPSGWVIAFNRAELKPKWGAWSPVLVAGAIAATVLWLMVTWCVLAALYAPAVWVAAVFADRDLNLIHAWRLSGAALMPGALIMTAAIAAYSLGLMDLVTFLFAFGVHLAAGWVFLFLSLLFVPGISSGRRGSNPFSGGRN